MTARKVVVVGAGALGSHLVLLGRNWPVAFSVVDFDRVEAKNLQSQFHTKQSVGRNKAVALQQAMAGLWGLKVEAVPHRLGPDNAAALLAGAALVVDCVDNAPTRRTLAAAAATAGVPCLHGAVAADGGYARVMWAPAFTIDEGGEGAATCEDGRHLAFVVRVAAQLATVAQGFLTTGRQDGWHLSPAGQQRV